jgi:hypothetical protein
VTDTTTTSMCANYDPPIVNQKGTNGFRISANNDVPLEECLAACTANSGNCAGISHKAGDGIAFACLRGSDTLLLSNTCSPPAPVTARMEADFWHCVFCLRLY